MDVKHIKDSELGDAKTFFPFGKTPLEAAQIIINVIKNPKEIGLLDSSNSKVIGLRIINQTNQVFKLFIRNNILTFFPQV